MPTDTDHQLILLRKASALVSDANESKSIHEVVAHVVVHVRDGTPAHLRDPAYLASLQKRLTIALTNLHTGNKATSSSKALKLTQAMSGAEGEFRALIETIATELEKLDEQDDAGLVLRASSDAIMRAAIATTLRVDSESALNMARQLEEPGAAPSILFDRLGSVVWVNKSLRGLLERRSIALETVLAKAVSTQAKQKIASARDESLGLLLAIKNRTRGDSGIDGLTVVEVSGAKRATALTAREIEVAQLVVELGKYKEVAAASNLALNSVRTYVRRIYRKFGIHNRSELKARLIREGLISK